MHNHKNLKKDLFPHIEILKEMSELLKQASDLTRLQILFSLIDGEKSVCCIQELINKSQSLVSHQLKSLKDANLVKKRSDKTRMLYSLKDEHVMMLLEAIYQHVQEKVSEVK